MLCPHEALNGAMLGENVRGRARDHDVHSLETQFVVPS